MTTIRINTEQVKQVGQRLLTESQHLEQLSHEISHAINSLDTWAWDGRSRADAEPVLDQVRPESRNLTDELERLGKVLQHVANCFENEDSTVARELGGLPWVEIPERPGITFPPPDSWSPLPILPPIDIFPCPRWPWILPFLPLLPFPLWPIILLPPPQLPEWIKPKPKPEPIPHESSPDEPEPFVPPNPPAQARTETVEVNKESDHADDNCVKFVKDQPRFQEGHTVPSGFDKGGRFYTGEYKGKSGTFEDGVEYGQEPRVGSVMAETPNGSNGVGNPGHASYVYEVEYDDSGKAVKYSIIEGSWDKNNPPNPKTRSFHWDETSGKYVSDTGARSPDLFVYT